MASPTLAIPVNVEAARKQVCETDFFGLCYLMLCNLAYTDEDNAQKAKDQIKTMLPNLPAPQGKVEGKWRCGWGPVASPDNSNLMFAAEFTDKVTNLPIFSAVVIRGTDTQAKGLGLFLQLVEDLDAKIQVVFPFNNPSNSARIAGGTLIGLNILTGFRDNDGRTVAGYLSNFVAANPGAPIVVTGHSLGGCQTTTMATFLKVELPAGTKIVPNSFAAPTAGNAAFIEMYEQAFPFCPRWFNTIDLVPMAYANVSGMANLWGQCNVPAPKLVQFLARQLQEFLQNDHYTQQSASTSRPLAGKCQPQNAKLGLEALAKVGFDDIKAIVSKGIRHMSLADAHSILFEDIHDWVQELLYQHLPMTGYWDQVANAAGVAPIPNPFQKAMAAAATPPTGR